MNQVVFDTMNTQLLYIENKVKGIKKFLADKDPITFQEEDISYVVTALQGIKNTAEYIESNIKE